MKGTYVEHLTWCEAEAALRQYPVVLLPLGARTKEHGPHLPLNNDWLIAEYLTRRVMERSRVLVFPTLQYGYYPAFLEYPGSVSIRRDALRDAIVDICRSAALHGARRFYVLNTGISTVSALGPARELLAAEGLVMEYSELDRATEDVREQVSEQPAGTHADEIETSMMLYIAPEVVRLNLARRDIHETKGPGGLTRNPNATTGVYSPTGSYGDPTRATREKGELVVESTVAYLISYLNDFARREC